MSAAPAVIDWPQMLRDMQYLLGDDLPGTVPERLPIGTRAFAQHLGVSRDLVRSWLNGVVPKHPEGEMIIQAWVEITSKPRVFVPMTWASSSVTKARMRG